MDLRLDFRSARASAMNEHLDRLAVCDWAGLFDLRHPALFCAPLSVATAQRLRGGLVYLATPYSKIAEMDGEFSDYRSGVAGSEAARWSLRLAVAGITCAAPIALAVAMMGEDPGRVLRPMDAAFWTAWCAPMLSACHAVAVPQIAGWDASVGVWHEVIVTLRSGRAVVVIEDETGEDWF